MNSEIAIYADEAILVKIPLAKVIQGIKGIQMSTENGYNMDADKMILETQKIQIKLHFPQNSAMEDNGGADKHYIDVTLQGVETKIKTN